MPDDAGRKSLFCAPSDRSGDPEFVCRGNQEEVDARNDVLEKYESMNHWADELFGKQKRVNFEMKTLF